MVDTLAPARLRRAAAHDARRRARRSRPARSPAASSTFGGLALLGQRARRRRQRPRRSPRRRARRRARRGARRADRAAGPPPGPGVLAARAAAAARRRPLRRRCSASASRPSSSRSPSGRWPASSVALGDPALGAADRPRLRRRARAAGRSSSPRSRHELRRRRPRRDGRAPARSCARCGAADALALLLCAARCRRAPTPGRRRRRPRRAQPDRSIGGAAALDLHERPGGRSIRGAAHAPRCPAATRRSAAAWSPGASPIGSCVASLDTLAPTRAVRRRAPTRSRCRPAGWPGASARRPATRSPCSTWPRPAAARGSWRPARRPASSAARRSPATRSSSTSPPRTAAAIDGVDLLTGARRTLRSERRAAAQQPGGAGRRPGLRPLDLPAPAAAARPADPPRRRAATASCTRPCRPAGATATTRRAAPAPRGAGQPSAARPPPEAGVETTLWSTALDRGRRLRHEARQAQGQAARGDDPASRPGSGPRAG